MTARLIDGKNGLPDPIASGTTCCSTTFCSLTNPAQTDRRRTTAAEVTDGLSNTWMYFESVAKPFMFGWYKRNADPAPLFYNGEENRAGQQPLPLGEPRNLDDDQQLLRRARRSSTATTSRSRTDSIPAASSSPPATAASSSTPRTIDPNVFVAHVTMAGDELP